VKLPKPQTGGTITLEHCLATRRSIRSFSAAALTIRELAQLLWAGQGITDRAGLRTAPSAGALYPLDLYAVAGNVSDIEPGSYRYTPRGHELVGAIEGDRLPILASAARQEWIAGAAAAIVIAGVFVRTTGTYGSRGTTYVHLEAGHVAQNIQLQAVALGLGSTVVGAFDDERVKEAAGIGHGGHALYIIPIGRS
jgi:SagB-type dehydrogenase family enzyme